MNQITRCTWSGQIRNSQIQCFKALYPRAAMSVTWTDEVRVARLGGVLALLDVQPALLHSSVVDHANQVQHS
eukprot:4652579-Pyramimonas_sp.AAC.1